jgi:RNA recognition motif-containing protein
MGNRLFVGNLPFDATEAQVKGLIAGGGRNVHSVKIVTDKDTGRSRGFAFVDVEDDAQAQSAIAELNGKDFNGRALVVNEAQERGGGGGGKVGGAGGFRGTPTARRSARVEAEASACAARTCPAAASAAAGAAAGGGSSRAP